MPVRFLVGEDFFAVGKDVERSRAAHLNAHGDAEFAFDVLFQAHGLGLQVVSEEAALDDDFSHYFFKTSLTISTDLWQAVRSTSM